MPLYWTSNHENELLENPDEYRCYEGITITSVPSSQWPTSIFRLNTIEPSELPAGVMFAGKYFPTNGDGTVISLEPHSCPKHALAYPGAQGFACVANGDYPSESMMTWFMHGTSNYREHFSTATVKTLEAESAGRGRSCGNCGFPGHNSRTCDVLRVYDKVGIEIEGRFFDHNQMRCRVEEAGAAMGSDGSIRRRNVWEPWSDTAEIQTKPGTIGQACKQLIDFYPDQADDSCGMHVHVSFLDDTYISQLYSEKFFQYFRAKWLAWADEKGLPAWHSLRRRLAGHNPYCLQNVVHNAPYTGDTRYRQLNFSSWRAHKTLECRLLPMFSDAKLGVEAVSYLLKIYHDWINTDYDSLEEPIQGSEVAAADMPEGVFEVRETFQACSRTQAALETSSVNENFSLRINIPAAPEPGVRRIFLTPRNREAARQLGIAA